MKQEQRREQTIKLLLDTVKELVHVKGCHSITMKDIMDKSGLSKGAIFHYVKTKDEIFVWILQGRLEETNRSFMNEVEQNRQSFDEPMRTISESIALYEDAQDVTNKVLLYLLGKEDQPMIAEALKEYYERSVNLSKEWIETGKKHGVIPESVDSEQTADMFVLLTLGLRVRASIPDAPAAFNAHNFSSWISRVLQPGEATKEMDPL